MAKSLLNKDISPACEYCLHGRPSVYSDEILCVKHGVTQRNDACRHYRYDVLKRKPHRISPAGKFTEKDFEL